MTAVPWRQHTSPQPPLFVALRRCVPEWKQRIYFSRPFLLAPHLLVRQAEEELPVKAAGPSESGVDRVKSVCSTDDHYLPAAVQPVHQGQQSGHDGAKGGAEGAGRKKNSLEVGEKGRRVLETMEVRGRRLSPLPSRAFLVGHFEKIGFVDGIELVSNHSRYSMFLNTIFVPWSKQGVQWGF